MIDLTTEHDSATRPQQRRLAEQQTLLLQAAVGPGDSALTAWRAWRLTADLDQLPPGGFGLLPLLAHNLQSFGINDPLLDKCQGIQRRTWTQNQLAFRQVTPLWQQLHAAGIPPIVHADTALALLHYPQLGTRMLDALNLLTAAADSARLTALLAQTGWQAQPVRAQWLRAQVLGPQAPRRFRLAAGGEPPLICQALSPRAGLAIEAVDPARLPIGLQALALSAPSPTDLLFDSCTRGSVNMQRYGTIQWLADAAILLQPGKATIDWGRIVARAKAEASALRLQVAFHSLQTTVDAPIPTAVIQALQALPIDPFERWELAPPAALPPRLQKLFGYWAAYRRR